VLISLAKTPAGVVGGAVFLTASVLLFGTSGVYHRGTWGARGQAILRRMDHSNIYVFIAATYTPLALILLDGASRMILLVLIWSAAVGGLLFRLLWLSAPRWLYTVLYIAMGWTALGWLGAFYHAAGPAVLILILAGGICYTLGAIVYARKRPDPSPAWFGYHEIFHVGTIAGFVCHYAAIFMITI
jgi:hemolysin III